MNESGGKEPPHERSNRRRAGVLRGHLDRLISEYPKSDVSPEAIYYRGVSRYKATNDAKHAHEALQANYKDSEWAKRASVYRLL